MMRKVAALFLFTLVLGGCALLEPAPAPEAVLDSAVSGTEGIAQVNAGGAALEFTTIDGISGERVAGIEVQVAAAGGARMVYAADPSGAHVPVAVPLPGTAAVRRLVMPPATDLGYNITTAAGSIDPLLLEPLGLLDEGQIRNRMRSAGDFAVLIYQYNPDQPLALTNAPLEAYATPFPQVTVLRPPVMEGSGALLVAGIARGSFGSWEHILVDRYLAGRIGQPPATDLSADLDFGWAYPVFEIFPGEAEIALGTDERALLMVNWRSPNPDPPGPWVFFVSTDDEERFSVEPQSFALGPDSPPQEVIVSVNRQGLAAGDYTTTIYIQPFSEAFGVIEQTAQRTLSFAVAEVIPTPTLGPQAEVAFVPTTPREGDVLTVNAAGFTPGEAVLITFEGGAQSFQDSQSTADTEGLFRYQLDLQGVSAGTYTLRVQGTASGAAGQAEVVIEEPVADAVVNTAELNLRTGPDFVYPVLEVLARGDELTVIATNDDDTWIEVIAASGQQGWVVTDLVDLAIDLATVPWNPNVPAPP